MCKINCIDVYETYRIKTGCNYLLLLNQWPHKALYIMKVILIDFKGLHEEQNIQHFHT